jgi:hypothetical protein
MKKTICKKCNRKISNANFKKHYGVCGKRTKYDKNGNWIKSSECKHCNKNWKELNVTKPSNVANHMRWCVGNPKRTEYFNNMKKVRDGITEESRRKMADGVIEAHARGCYDHVERNHFLGKKHTKESKLKMRDAALASNHRRLRRGVVEYKGVMLDSSWELALAKRLDELEIKWERPKPMKWTDKLGLEHNYFSDFYLPEYDLYLDPKNPAAYLNQIEKVNVLLKMDINIIFIKTLDECKTFSIK